MNFSIKCSLLAVFPALFGCGKNPPVAPVVVSHAVIVSGNGQVQVPGTQLFSPLVIQLVDADGDPAPSSGRRISWEVTSGSGSLTVNVDTTTASGFASAWWWLGGELGLQRVGASVEGLPSLEFSADARLPGPIVFVSGRSGLVGNSFDGFPGDLYAMEEDGSHVMPLFPPTVGAQYLTDPVWAPDGRSVLFARSTGRPAGGTPGLLHDGIHRLDMATLVVSQVPAGGFPSFVDFYRQPTWSPDGMHIVVWLDTAIGTQNIPPDIAPGHLHVMTDQGFGEDPVMIANAAQTMSSDWSATSNLLVFVCVLDTTPDICSSAADGSNLMQLTAGDAVDDDPRWSPDGTQILFVRDRAMDGGVWLMAADGSGQAQVLPGNLSSPAWSPDGTAFLVTLETAGDQEIYLVEVSTQTSVNLTNSPFRDRDPAWRR